MESFISFIFHANNVAFVTAALILGAVLLLEIIMLVVGGSLSFLDGDVDLDADSDMDLGGIMGWLNPNRIPFMMLLTVFLAAFSVVGLSVQWALNTVGVPMLHWLMAVPIAVALSLPIVRVVSRLTSRILPKDDTSAISLVTLSGRYGIVVIGPVTSSMMGEARFRDDHGTWHYLKVLAEGTESIETGDDVVLLEELPNGKNIFVVRKHG